MDVSNYSYCTPLQDRKPYVGEITMVKSGFCTTFPCSKRSDTKQVFRYLVMVITLNNRTEKNKYNMVLINLDGAYFDVNFF